MKVHYLYKRTCWQHWHYAVIEAWLERDHINKKGETVKEFQHVEKVKIFIEKEHNHVQMEVLSSATNTWHASSEMNTRRKFLDYKTDKQSRYEGMQVVKRHQYERLRKVFLALFLREDLIDFDRFKGPQTEVYRTII